MSNFQMRNPPGVTPVYKKMAPLLCPDTDTTYVPLSFMGNEVKTPWEADLAVVRNRNATDNEISNSTSGYMKYEWRGNGMDRTWDSRLREPIIFDDYTVKNLNNWSDHTLPTNWANKYYVGTLYDTDGSISFTEVSANYAGNAGILFNLNTLSGITTDSNKMSYCVSVIMQLDRNLLRPLENKHVTYTWSDLPGGTLLYNQLNADMFINLGVGDCSAISAVDITGTVQPPLFNFYFGLKGGVSVTPSVSTTSTFSGGPRYSAGTYNYNKTTFNLTSIFNNDNYLYDNGGYAKYYSGDSNWDYLYVNYTTPISAHRNGNPVSAISPPVIGLVHNASYTTGCIWTDASFSITGYLNGTGTQVVRTFGRGSYGLPYGMGETVGQKTMEFNEFYNNKLDVSTQIYMRDLTFGISCDV